MKHLWLKPNSDGAAVGLHSSKTKLHCYIMENIPPIQMHEALCLARERRRIIQLTSTILVRKRLLSVAIAMATGADAYPSRHSRDASDVRLRRESIKLMVTEQIQLQTKWTSQGTTVLFVTFLCDVWCGRARRQHVCASMHAGLAPGFSRLEEPPHPG
ncbi:uncharacterized protein LOC144006821 isoform X2 [Festucalex cinctus]